MNVFHNLSKQINNPRRLMFLSLLILGMLIHYPQQDFWPLIVQGDLSRDLYVYQLTQSGELPYRDYFYNYGPLMPFYYAFFYTLFGVKFSSILLGVIALDMVSGMLIYLILARLTTPLIAFLGASWFWLFYEKLIFNFNHFGAVPLILLNLYWLIKFYDKPEVKLFVGVLGTVFLLLLVKINLGVCVLAYSWAVVLAMRITGRLKVFRFKSPLLILALLPLASAAFVYWLLLHGLPGYYVKQCLPSSLSYMQYKSSLSLPQRIFGLVNSRFWGLEEKYAPTSSFSSLWPDRFIILSFCAVILMFALKSFLYKKDLRSLLILVTALLFLSHEFIILGVRYELWMTYPVFICLLFFLAGELLKGHRLIRAIWSFLAAAMLAAAINGVYSMKNEMIKYKDYFLMPFEKMQVYSFNPPNWVYVAESTTNYLKAHLSPGEKFLAVPYEPMYYWLLDRRAPVKETMFFDFVNITAEQQKRIISDLEKEHVNYIVMSNRVHSPEVGLGVFGATNCHILGDYIKKNFIPMITFGKWGLNPEWSWDHSIRIFQRKAKEQNTGYLSFP